MPESDSSLSRPDSHASEGPGPVNSLDSRKELPRNIKALCWFFPGLWSAVYLFSISRLAHAMNVPNLLQSYFAGVILLFVPVAFYFTMIFVSAWFRKRWLKIIVVWCSLPFLWCFMGFTTGSFVRMVCDPWIFSNDFYNRQENTWH